MFASKTGCNSTCCLDSGEQICYFDHAHQMLTRILRKFEYFGNIIKKKKPVNNSFTGFCCFLLLLSAERKRFELSMQLPTYHLSRVAPSTTRAPLYRAANIVNRLLFPNAAAKSNAHFSSEWLAEHVDARPAGAFTRENVHHFGDGGFGSNVGAADDAYLLQELAGLVLPLRYAAAIALGDVE